MQVKNMLVFLLGMLVSGNALATADAPFFSHTALMARSREWARTYVESTCDEYCSSSVTFIEYVALLRFYKEQWALTFVNDRDDDRNSGVYQRQIDALRSTIVPWGFDDFLYLGLCALIHQDIAQFSPHESLNPLLEKAFQRPALSTCAIL